MKYSSTPSLSLDDYETLALARCSLDSSPKQNWVEKQGGLPNYICEIARAIKRSGRPTSQAIAIAVSRVKAWASGRGNVNADTRAKAARAVAQWEKLKAKAKADNVDLSNTDSYEIYLNELVGCSDIEVSDATLSAAARLEDCSDRGLDKFVGLTRQDKDILRLSELSTKSRKRLDDGQFAIVENGKRKYPIHDESHARNALARVEQYGSDEEKKKVCLAVVRKYPNIDTDCKKRYNVE